MFQIFFWQVASVSQGFFKHQQRGDPDLTKQEKQKIAAQLLDNRPAVFLQRYFQGKMGYF